MKKTLYYLVLAVIAASLFLSSGRLYASEMDDRIETSGKQSYVFKTYLKGDDIKIQSKDGAVTLTGTVSDESNKTLAKETVAGFPGVKSVDNKLEVKEEVSAEFSDAWLITKVKSTLLFHRNVNATGTVVLSEGGTVTLRGKAVSEAQKDLTGEYAGDVAGVNEVKNEMTVSTAEMKSGGKTMGEKMDDMGETIDDASITALVKMTLLYHRSTSAINTTVETKDGLVTLGGEAGNAAEKDLATKFVSDVHGVRNVVNHMTIE